MKQLAQNYARIRRGIRLRLDKRNMVKIKCKCGHGKDVHAPNGKKGGDYDGECCVIYRDPNGNLKSCPCYAFSEQKGESGPRKRLQVHNGGSLDSNRKIKPSVEYSHTKAKVSQNKDI